MRCLLDTHAFLWWITDDSRLPERARSLIRESGNEIVLSAASSWEMAIKVQLGKLEAPRDLAGFVIDHLQRNRFGVLPIHLRHSLAVATLPLLHRDPFDRMLVVQSQLEEMPILTGDPLIRQYAVETVW